MELVCTFLEVVFKGAGLCEIGYKWYGWQLLAAKYWWVSVFLV